MMSRRAPTRLFARLHRLFHPRGDRRRASGSSRPCRLDSVRPERAQLDARRGRRLTTAPCQTQHARTFPARTPRTDPGPGWSAAQADRRLLVLANGADDRGLRRRRDRLGGRRSLLQHRDDRIRGDPDRPFLRRPDHHLHLPPHRGGRNVNDEDIETVNPAAASAGASAPSFAPTSPSRPTSAPPAARRWLKARGIIGVTGVDTRALTTLIRRDGMPNAVIAHSPMANSIATRCAPRPRAGPASTAWTSCRRSPTAQRYDWDETSWTLDAGYGKRQATRFRVVAVDYGDQAQHPEAAQRLRLRGHGGSGDGLAPRTSSRSSPTAFFCRTDPATPRRPANTPCRRSSAARDQDAAVRHLPRPSDPRARPSAPAP
jgi:hypothetical protein